MTRRFVIDEDKLIAMIKRHARPGTDAEKVAAAFLRTYGSIVTTQVAVHGHVHEWVRPEGYLTVEVCRTCGRQRQ